MSFSKTVAYCCLFFTGGIFFYPALHFSFIFLFFGIALFFVFRKKKIIICTFFLLAFFAGGWCYQLAEKEALESPLNYLNNTGEEIIFTGIVDEEADIREKSMKLTLGNVEVGSQGIEGKILVTTGKYPRYEY